MHTIALIALDMCVVVKCDVVRQLHSMCVKCDVVHRVVHSVWQCTLVWLSERAPGCLWQLCHAAFLKETKISHFLLGKNKAPLKKKIDAASSAEWAGGVMFVNIFQKYYATQMG